MPSLPGVTGQDYTIDDVIQALINAGVTDINKLIVAGSIAMGENATSGVGNTNSLNAYEYNQGVPIGKLATGPFQIIHGYHPNTNQVELASSLQASINYVAPMFAKGDFSPWGGTADPAHVGYIGPATAAVQRVTSGQGQFLVVSAGNQTGTLSLPKQAAQAVTSVISKGTSAVQNIFAPAGTRLIAAGESYANDDERYLFLKSLNPANLGAAALAFISQYESSHAPVSGGRNAPRINLTGGSDEETNPVVPIQGGGVFNPGAGLNTGTYISSGGMFGNQTTPNNAQAQGQFAANTAAAQVAAAANPNSPESIAAAQQQQQAQNDALMAAAANNPGSLTQGELVQANFLANGGVP